MKRIRYALLICVHSRGVSCILANSFKRFVTAIVSSKEVPARFSLPSSGVAHLNAVLHGITLFGGSATERNLLWVCSAAATNPNYLNYCDQSKSGIPWRTQFKLSGTYPLPWWGIHVSGSLQALPGYVLGTNAGGTTNVNGASSVLTVTPTTRYTVRPGSSAQNGCVAGNVIIPGMNMASLSVPLVAPGTELTPRLNQLDLSFAKRVKLERFQFNPKLDIFNALNSSDYFTVRSLSYSTAAGATYRQPGSILQGRILRIGAVVNW